MPKTAKIKLTKESGAGSEVAEATFSDEEWHRMVAFIGYAEALQRTELVSKGAPGQLSLKLNMQTEGMIKYEIKLPPDDHISALLHRLRPFILQKERTNFNAVCNFIARRFESQGVCALIAKLKSIFSGEDGQQLIKVSANETILNSEQVLMKWLNAHEYHRDQDKQAELTELHAMLPLDASKVFFVCMLHDKAKAILVLASWLRLMNGDEKSLAFRL